MSSAFFHNGRFVCWYENESKRSLAMCDFCKSVFNESETVVLGQHSDLENKTVCFLCCAKLCEQQCQRITELELENERLRAESKTWPALKQ